MNHLGDTNEMVVEDVSNEQMTAQATPNEELRRQILSHCVAKNEREWWASRTIEKLERELNVASKERDDALMMLGMYRMKSDDQKQRIKRLEDAVEAYRTAYTPDGHVAPHDCFATGPKTGDPIQDLIACPGCWAERKAKEVKP